MADVEAASSTTVMQKPEKEYTDLSHRIQTAIERNMDDYLYLQARSELF